MLELITCVCTYKEAEFVKLALPTMDRPLLPKLSGAVAVSGESCKTKIERNIEAAF
jgi:hypothetical protein